MVGRMERRLGWKEGVVGEVEKRMGWEEGVVD